MFNEDPGTDAVVLIGEIGGVAEQQAAEYIASEMRKPVVAFIAGASAPPGRRMGHAGAIIVGNSGTATAKKAALRDAGATIVDSPADIGEVAQQVLGKRRPDEGPSLFGNFRSSRTSIPESGVCQNRICPRLPSAR